MKPNLSNNSLAVLLIFAIVISVVGTWISVSYIEDLNQLTGLATSDIGNTTLTVTSETSCTTDNDDVIAFGNLGRNETNQSEDAANDFIILENNGNTALNVSVNVTSSNLVLWDDSVYGTIGSTYWRIRCVNTQSGSCINSTYVNLPSDASTTLLVADLDPSDSSDNLSIAINVTVPDDESSGAKMGQVTFYCIAS